MPLVEQLYRKLYLIRRVEEEIARVYPTDKVKSPVHLSIGQEAIAVGACAALEERDVVFGTYRSHAAYLAKGGDLRGMIAELYGKATGCAKGKAGSMHLIDVSAGVMGASAVVATTIPHAVGFAYAQRIQKTGRLTVCFFGDGAVEQGVFHESLNFASLKKVPLILVCENNGYAIHSRQSDRQGFVGICELARTEGIPAERIESTDAVALHDKVRAAADEIRNGRSGPRFFECLCYRWKEHVGPGDDFQAGYRSAAECQPWKDHDEVARLAAMLDPRLRVRIEREIETDIADAFEFAEAGPLPDESELYADLYA